MINDTDGNWDEWRNHVLCELRRFNSLQMAAAAERKQISTDISTVKQTIAELRVKTDQRSAIIAGIVSLMGVIATLVLGRFVP